MAPLLRRLAAAGLCACLPWLGLAEPLTVQVDAAGGSAPAGARWLVFLAGEIDADAAGRVEGELSPLAGDGAMVYFDSPGGNLAAAMQIGRLLRGLGASATVGRRGTFGQGVEPGLCLSACSLAFLGGVYRYFTPGSLYGVHRAATTAPSDQDFDAGQIVLARIAAYVRQMGVDGGLVDRMVRAGRGGMYLLDASELRGLGVVNDGRLPPEWSAVTAGRQPVLTGSQQTADGLERAVFDCREGAVVFHSLYQAGSSAPLIASGQWNHSLLVDNRSLPLDPPTAIEDDDGTLNATFSLPPDVARRIVGATSVGHAMRDAGSGPASLGYRIDIGAAATGTVWNFVVSCLKGR